MVGRNYRHAPLRNVLTLSSKLRSVTKRQEEVSRQFKIRL